MPKDSEYGHNGTLMAHANNGSAHPHHSPPGGGTGAVGTKEGDNESPKPDDPAPDAIDEVDHAQDPEPLPPQRPGLDGQSLAYINGDLGTAKQHMTTDRVDPGDTTPRTPLGTQTTKGQGKCTLGCCQALKSHQREQVHQPGFAQADQMCVTQECRWLNEHATPPIMNYDQAIKGRQFPDWDSGGPAKFGTRGFTYCSPEDRDRGL